MPGTTPNTRVIFQNSNVFVGPAGLSGNTATGQLFSSGNSGLNFIGQLSRVQSVSLNVDINRTDIQELGQLFRIDSEILSPPGFGMSFTYFVTDGLNEAILGLSAKGGASFISGLLTKASDSKNYFVSYSPQGIDDDGFGLNSQRDLVALGNGFITNYTLNASVGQPVTADVSVEGLNVVSYLGSSGFITPAVDPATSVRISQWSGQLPFGDPQTGLQTISILRPGDITLSFPTSAGFLVPLSGTNGININSVSLSIPIARETMNRLGSPFGFSKEINFPVNCTMQISATQTALQAAGFDTLICADPSFNCRITMRQPSCAGTGLNAIVWDFNNAFLTNQSLSNGVGSDGTVSLSMTSQLAGATSTAGIVMSGFY